MNEKIKTNEQLAKDAAALVNDAYNSGYHHAKTRIYTFFKECANNIDFGNDSPKQVILCLLDIVDEMEQREKTNE